MHACKFVKAVCNALVLLCAGMLIKHSMECWHACEGLLKAACAVANIAKLHMHKQDIQQRNNVGSLVREP